MDLYLILAGLVIGTLIGISGVGGSSLMTPLLVLLLGVKPLIAIGTDLAYSVPTKLLGAFIHHRQGTVDWKVVRALGLGGIPAAIVGLVGLAIFRASLGLDTLNTLLQHGVGLLLLLVAVALLFTPLLSRRKKTPVDAPPLAEQSRQSRRRVIALGALIGFLVSITSIGSGSITVPALYWLLPHLGLRRLVGSNIAFAALIIPIAALGHLQMGDVDLRLTLNLLLGALPGVFFGSKLCARLPDAWLRPAVAGILLLAGSRLL